MVYASVVLYASVAMCALCRIYASTPAYNRLYGPEILQATVCKDDTALHSPCLGRTDCSDVMKQSAIPHVSWHV